MSPLPASVRRALRAIDDLEDHTRALTDDELAGSHARLAARAGVGEGLTALRPEAFALVREAARRTLGLRLRDVQMMTAIVCDGNIAEMRTGEGKTLAAAPAMFLRSLFHPNVHAVTANAYLAERDAALMGPVFGALGARTAALDAATHEPSARRAFYEVNITYGTLSEFAFDYLRDNLAHDPADVVQRGLGYCLIDEADSVLIDEAKTPLVIAGQDSMSADVHHRLARIVASFVEGEDYIADRARGQVSPTPSGIAALQDGLEIADLYRPEHLRLVNGADKALRAHALLRRDRDYLVRDGQVHIIDSNTGRVMEGRSWADGLQQAVEASEGLPTTPETRHLAEITVQSYLRLYERRGGMSGTAATDAAELERVYGMSVRRIPTHRPVIRVDHPDEIYANDRVRLRALVARVHAERAAGRPVLIGTPSVAMSERVSAALGWSGIAHRCLNARAPASEADIIADAGQVGAVTVATNMAGRGVDIHLPDEVIAAGGMAVIGTSRHEARRTDDQLIGRAGRQGEPGSSVFMLSADDELVSDFAGDRVARLLALMPGDADTPLTSRSLARAVASAQQSAERRDAEERTTTFLYDQVVHRQRLVWFAERRLLLHSPEPELAVLGTLLDEARRRAPLGEDMAGRALPDDPAEATERVRNGWLAQVAEHPEVYRYAVRAVALRLRDEAWRAHVETMVGLRAVIELRAHARRQPLLEYAREGQRLFEATRAELAAAHADALPRILIGASASA